MLELHREEALDITPILAQLNDDQKNSFQILLHQIRLTRDPQLLIHKGQYVTDAELLSILNHVQESTPLIQLSTMGLEKLT